MTAQSNNHYSLQRRLLWLLFAVIVLVAIGQAAITYRAALAQADLVFDRQMHELALAIRSGRFDRSAPAAVQESAYVVQVWSSDGRRLYRSTQRSVVPARRQPGYSVARTGERTYRVYSLDNRGESIQIAQDLDARASQARRMALASTWPLAVLVPVLMLLTAWVVRRSLKPVERARKELASRASDDLAPVMADGLPTEVQPLVGEINNLFDRVNSSLQAQKNFVADAAHELRSPLTALKVQVQNLQNAHEREDELQYGYSLIRLEQGVNRASRLVDQLLSLARHQTLIDDGAQPQTIQLHELVRDCVAEMAPVAAARQIDLGIESNDQTLAVAGWPETLQIMLRNLIENAIKYTPAGGVVDVSVTLENDQPTLVVEDSGPGIDPDMRERVLDRFYRLEPLDQADSTSGDDQDAAAVPGSGLGLAIVKSIAQRHQAHLLLARSARLGGLRVSASFGSQA